MLTHTFRSAPRLALAAVIGAALAAGAHAGPAAASDDPGTAAGQASADHVEQGMRKAGGDPGYIIAI
jgi:hypothetical protein